ncbi:MAG TPA: hypothetical protein VLQ80_29905, partial [Candidatus Saccharimonadia bacterium]|nr:hypothetical protein [Candidatus Saccharimonadia bacterium]
MTNTAAMRTVQLVVPCPWWRTTARRLVPAAPEVWLCLRTPCRSSRAVWGLYPSAARGAEAGSVLPTCHTFWPPPSRWGLRRTRGPRDALDICPQPWRQAPPMRPAPSLAYVSTLLDPRRRRHHRARRLWYAGLGLLGLGLLLGGWWVTRRLVPRSAPAATAVA